MVLAGFGSKRYRLDIPNGHSYHITEIVDKGYLYAWYANDDELNSFMGLQPEDDVVLDGKTMQLRDVSKHIGDILVHPRPITLIQEVKSVEDLLKASASKHQKPENTPNTKSLVA